MKEGGGGKGLQNEGLFRFSLSKAEKKKRVGTLGKK